MAPFLAMSLTLAEESSRMPLRLTSASNSAGIPVIEYVGVDAAVQIIKKY